MITIIDNIKSAAQYEHIKAPRKATEAKNFYGGAVTMLCKQLRKQTTKYVEHFGPGVVVFRGGFCAGVQEAVAPGVQIIGFEELSGAIVAAAAAGGVAEDGAHAAKRAKT